MKKTTPKAPLELPLLLPRFSSISRLFLFPLCLFSPEMGLTLGVLYLGQKDPAARRFGLFCLLLAFLGGAVKIWREGQSGKGAGADMFSQPFY